MKPVLAILLLLVMATPDQLLVSCGDRCNVAVEPASEERSEGFGGEEELKELVPVTPFASESLSAVSFAADSTNADLEFGSVLLAEDRESHFCRPPPRATC